MDSQLQLEIDRPLSGEGVWHRLLRLMEGRLGREAVRTWLRPARPASYGEGRFVLAVGTRTARDWIERKYGAALAAGLAELAGAPVELEVVVQAEAEPSPGATRAAPPAPRRPPAETSPGSSPFPPTPLNEKYTFANFVVGPSNRFA